MRNTSDTRAARFFQARHSAYPQRVIVVKTFKSRPGASAALRVAAWKREYHAHRQLEITHIVELLGGDAHLRALFLEKVDAPDLRRREWCDLKGDKRFRGTLADARRVLQDMAAALEYLHKKEILHNDIKPANILYYKTNGAVLADVGLATDLTSVPSSGGTPWYVPPEFLSRRQRGAPADVFALGIVMIYLLGYIATPECEQQAKTWLIARVHDVSASPAAMAMVNWLGVVRDTRKQLQEATDRTAQLVLGMLEQRPQDRITACELDTAILSI